MGMKALWKGVMVFIHHRETVGLADLSSWRSQHICRVFRNTISPLCNEGCIILKGGRRRMALHRKSGGVSLEAGQSEEGHHIKQKEREGASLA